MNFLRPWFGSQRMSVVFCPRCGATTEWKHVGDIYDTDTGYITGRKYEGRCSRFLCLYHSTRWLYEEDLIK